MMLEFINSDEGKHLLESEKTKKEAEQHLFNLYNADLTASYHAREQQNRIEVFILKIK